MCVGLVLPGCLPSGGKTESTAPATRTDGEADAPAPKLPERPLVESAVLEWEWRELAGPLEGHVDSVAFSQDGRLVAAGAKDTICVWARDTGKLVTRMTLPEDQVYHRLTFTSDGKSLISDCREDRFVRFWDVKTGKQTKEIAQAPPGGKPDNFSSRFKAFDPSGGRLVRDGASVGFQTGFEVVDLSNGKVAAEVTPGEWDAWSEVSFHPDGKTFALNGPGNQLRIFETASAKLVKELRPPHKSRGGWQRSFVRFSPSGHFLIAQEHTGRVETFDIYRHVIWGVADGRRYFEQEAKPRVEHVPQWVSAGDRYTLYDDKAVFDLLTDQLIPIRNAAAAGRRLTATSADGKVLAFVGPASDRPEPGGRGSQKTSVYLTAAPVLPPVGGLAGGDLAPAELESAWRGAVADNLFRREHSLKVLGLRPKQAVALAERKLKPVPEAEGKRVAALVSKLDDDDADVRDAATADLHSLAHQFEPYLRVAQKAAKPGEVRNRLIRVVQKVVESTPPAELGAELRGVALLEQLRTADARTLLDKLAGGVPGARVTSEAAAALKRLDQPKP